VLSRDIVRICLGTSFHLTIPPEGLATVAISVIATAPRPSSEWAQLGASAGRESSRPRTSAQQRRRATGALALRGCGLGLASDLEWSCRTTLVHVLAALLSDAINLATRSTELRFSGQADPSFCPSPSCSMHWKDGRSSCRGTRDGPARGSPDTRPDLCHVF
jgi:hypothetical protein